MRRDAHLARRACAADGAAPAASVSTRASPRSGVRAIAAILSSTCYQRYDTLPDNRHGCTSWEMRHDLRSYSVRGDPDDAVFTLAAFAAQQPPRPDPLAEPFKGVTTDGTVKTGLFPCETRAFDRPVIDARPDSSRR